MAEHTQPRTQNPDPWIRQLQHASRAGDLNSTLTLRQCYLEGRQGLQADPQQALRCTMLAASQGDPRSMYHTAVVEYAQGQFESSFRWMMRSWRAGILEASFGLARAYARGQGTGKDLDKALEYLEEARECQAEPEQREKLFVQVMEQKAAQLVRQGELQQAISLLQQLHTADSCLQLAWLDPANRLHYLQEAADIGNARAMYALARSTGISSREAFEQLRNAAKAGCVQAWAPLARLYGPCQARDCPVQYRRWQQSVREGRELSLREYEL